MSAFQVSPVRNISIGPAYDGNEYRGGCCIRCLGRIQRIWSAFVEAIKTVFRRLFYRDNVHPAGDPLPERRDLPPLSYEQANGPVQLVLPARASSAEPAAASEPAALAPPKPVSLVQDPHSRALGLSAIAREVNAYANAWDALRGNNSTLPLQKELTTDGSLQKYLAFFTLGRFEYSLYPDSYRGYYFAVIRRDMRLLTMELLKLEQEARALSDQNEQRAILLRIGEALIQVARAASTGCDPQKATVTQQQLKQVSARVDVFETIMQHIQDAKRAIFTKRVNGKETVLQQGQAVEKTRNSIDESVWASHCYNWIYANFGQDFGLCDEQRLVEARRDQYSRDPSVTVLTAELTRLDMSGEMRQAFRREFTKEYLEDAILDAMNMDEYQKPYMEALQMHCKELQENPKLWENYMKTILSPRGTSYIFTKEAVAFFLQQTNEGGQSLQIHWDNDKEFWNFIQNRVPVTYDGVSQAELYRIDVGHLLRLWRTYFLPAPVKV